MSQIDRVAFRKDRGGDTSKTGREKPGLIDRLKLREGQTVRTVSLIALVFATVLATQGAIVRATGSGLGCPDWPLCHGSLTPPPGNIKAIIEYSHRILATIGGLMILSTAILTLVNKQTSASLRTASIALILLLVVQILLGAAAVLQELPPWIVTAHLVSATTLIGLLTFVSIRITRSNSTRPASFQPMFWLPIAAATATALVIAAGGYTSSSYAGVACPEWPLCGNQIIPVGDQGHGPAIHMIHRVLAAVASLLVLLTAWRLHKVRNKFPEAARLGIVASHLIIVEFWVGAANAMSLTNEIVTAIHSFVAQWVWIVTLAIVVTVLAPDKTRSPFRTSPEP